MELLGLKPSPIPDVEADGQRLSTCAMALVMVIKLFEDKCFIQNLIFLKLNCLRADKNVSGYNLIGACFLFLNQNNEFSNIQGHVGVHLMQKSF